MAVVVSITMAAVTIGSGSGKGGGNGGGGGKGKGSRGHYGSVSHVHSNDGGRSNGSCGGSFGG